MAIDDDIKVTINFNKLVEKRAKLLTQYGDFSEQINKGEFLDENDIDEIALELRSTLTWSALNQITDDAIKRFLYLDETKYIKKYKEDPPKGAWEGKPQINNYLGSCFLKIATHLSYKPNFVNYMFREDMICDGIENCVQYIKNFNPEKSSNPFAYFTQIIHYAFLRRIQKEKRQMDIRSKIIERSGFEEVMSGDGDVYSSSDYNSIKENIQNKQYS